MSDSEGPDRETEPSYADLTERERRAHLLAVGQERLEAEGIIPQYTCDPDEVLPIEEDIDLDEWEDET